MTTYKLFVGGLPEGCKAKDLEDLFTRFGRVIECDVVGKYGFVHMVNIDEANDAIKKLNNYRFMGSQLTVEHSISKSKRTFNTMRRDRMSPNLYYDQSFGYPIPRTHSGSMLDPHSLYRNHYDHYDQYNGIGPAPYDPYYHNNRSTYYGQRSQSYAPYSSVYPSPFDHRTSEMYCTPRRVPTPPIGLNRRSQSLTQSDYYYDDERYNRMNSYSYPQRQTGLTYYDYPSRDDYWYYQRNNLLPQKRFNRRGEMQNVRLPIPYRHTLY